MRRLSLNSLRVQAILLTLVPLTIIILIVGSVGIFAYGEVVSRLVQDRDKELARISADRLSQNLSNLGSVLEAMVAQMSTVDCFDEEGRFSEGECFENQSGFITSVIQNCLLDDFVRPVTLLYAEGSRAISISSVGTTYESNQEPVCEPAYHTIERKRANIDAYLKITSMTGQTYFSDILISQQDEEAQIVIAVPIIDQQENFIGVLTGSFLLTDEKLGEEIAKLGVGTAYLVDRRGRVIWHPDESLLGTDFSEQAPVKDLLDLENDADAQKLSDAQGQTIVAGYAVVKPTGWGLVIQESWDVLMGPVRTFQWLMMGAVAVGLMLVMVIISSGTRRLTDPIKALVTQSQQLARGDNVGQLEKSSIREMQALSEAFNKMADRVARSQVGLQRYVAAITETQEEERKRIARELHDDTIQSLIALGRRIELLENSLENPIEAAKQLYQLQKMLTGIIDEVRRFSRDLRPLLLEDLGLLAAMRQMLREMERQHHIQTHLVVEGECNIDTVDDKRVVIIYRMAQEALSNIRKHAKAKEVDVTLSFDHEGVWLLVCDDGQGFQLAETSELAERGSFGLMGMHERARLFGGTIDIESELGKGTCVSAYLPHTVKPEWMLDKLKEVPIDV